MMTLLSVCRYIPNVLTVSRMLSAPFIWYAIVAQWTMVALILVTCAIVSDMGDGYIARRLFVSSRSGSFLDPLADKVFIIAAFCGLYSLHIVPWWVVMVVVLRDVLVTWLRIFLLRRGLALKTSWFAKSKTAFQFVALYFFISANAYAVAYGAGWLPPSFYSLSVIIALLTVLSSVGYWCTIIRWMTQRRALHAKK